MQQSQHCLIFILVNRERNSIHDDETAENFINYPVAQVSIVGYHQVYD